MNPQLRRGLTNLFGSLTLILTVLLLGFPERVIEPLVIAWIICFSLWATLGRYWAGA